MQIAAINDARNKFMPRQLGILIALVCLAAASGCNLCCWGKRNSELTGPTDIRKSQAWCLGEDAIFHQPMGPSRSNYGMKPTCWREWQPSGPACADGSCGPLFAPNAPIQHAEIEPQLAPPQHQHINPSGNPFGDDAQPLPPPNAGAKRQAIPQRVRMAATAEPAEFPTLFTPPQTPKPRTTTARTRPAAAKLPPRVVVKSAPPATSTQLAQRPAENSAIAETAPLRITVSDSYDLPPARMLAPVAAPGVVVQSSLPAPADFQAAHETLVSLERMVDVNPTTTDRDHSGPAVVRNEFVAPAQPFRLATRHSQPPRKRDPELDRQTLSALGDMMSND